MYALSEPLGKSKLSSEFAPSWNVHVLEGEIDSTHTYETGSFSATKIPQINVNISYDFKNIREGNAADIDVEEENDDFEIGEYLYDLEKEDLIIDLTENNADFAKENFDIEVFEVVRQTESDDELLVQLSFHQTEISPEPELILTDKPLLSPYFDPTPEHVSYYFEISTDEDISDEVIAKHLVGSKVKNLLNDKIITQQDPAQEMGDIYDSGDTEYEEECD